MKSELNCKLSEQTSPQDGDGWHKVQLEASRQSCQYWDGSCLTSLLIMWMMGKNVPSATADHKKLGMADMPDGHAAIQRELSWPAK